MNVWKIFRQSFFHLTNHQNLYDLYSNEYYDYFLYSPSFAVLFSPFSLLPDIFAYFVWNNINMLIIPFCIFKIKGIASDKKSIICYIALIEMATCLQGTQSNVFIAALMLITFLSFEQRNYWLAAIAIAIGVYIKVFPLVGASLFLLYPNKIKFAASFLLAMLILGALPLLFIPPSELIWQYQNWGSILALDNSDQYGRISITGFFEACLNVSVKSRLIIQVLGILVFTLMYLRKKCFQHYQYRLYFLCAMMIWVVIFNHAAEIYSYAIAIIGVGIWFVTQPQRRYNTFLIVAFIFFASILSIDPTPKIISDYIYQHSLKSLPFAMIFAIIIFQMLRGINFSTVQNKL
jgi:hypothetical protein